ncbi:MAG: hypothetical protein HY001_03925 [Candidatus Portnoybacteria bacterium]|nr:hypothetical protein [Candidatus Portnoybacteria bacterium]
MKKIYSVIDFASLKTVLVSALFLLISLEVLLLLLAGEVKDTFKPGGVHSVVLKSSGFYPSQITIFQGDTVRFSSERNALFWPASNDHPSHALYAKFDAKRPIPPTQYWDFVFDKPGRYDYHDHLSPSANGEITVVNANDLSSIRQGCGVNDKLSLECRKRRLTSLVEKDGIEAVFRLFRNNSLDVQDGICHTLAHEFGKIALEKYAKGAILPLNQDTSFCEFGFWHGFMDAFTKKYKHIALEEIRNVCLKIEEQDKSGKNIAWNCWHGLGLAAVSDPPEMDTWGNFRLMAERAFPFCENVALSDSQLSSCIEGVFHAEITYMMYGNYGLAFNTKSPLLLCQSQHKYYSECYAQLAPQTASTVHLALMQDSNLLSGLSSLERDLFVSSASLKWIGQQLNAPDFITHFISDCHRMNITFKDKCLEGGVRGLFFKEDKEAYLLLNEFCSSSQLALEEKNQCYGTFGKIARNYYSEKEIDQICTKVEKRYREYCLNTTDATDTSKNSVKR